jgi:hypothetical protein
VDQIATGLLKFDCHWLLKPYIYLCIEHSSSKHTSKLSGFVFEIMGKKPILKGLCLWNKLLLKCIKKYFYTLYFCYFIIFYLRNWTLKLWRQCEIFTKFESCAVALLRVKWKVKRNKILSLIFAIPHESNIT